MKRNIGGKPLDDGQEEAMDLIADFAQKPGFGVFPITGPGGAGKTALLPLIAEEFGGQMSGVTPTNKAAKVAQQRLTAAGYGHIKVQTIDRTLVKSFNAPVYCSTCKTKTYKVLCGHVNSIREGFERGERRQNAVSGCLFLDEASMVDQDAGAIVEAACRETETKLIVMGDHRQLGPVRGVAYWAKELADPRGHGGVHLTVNHRALAGGAVDVFTDYFYRRAWDEPADTFEQLCENLLPLAVGYRLGDAQTSAVRVISREEYEMFASHFRYDRTVTLVGTNEERQSLNQEIRGHRWPGKKLSGALPVEGDLLMARFVDPRLGIMKGSEFRATSDARPCDIPRQLAGYLETPECPDLFRAKVLEYGMFEVDLMDEDGEFVDLGPIFGGSLVEAKWTGSWDAAGVITAGVGAGKGGWPLKYGRELSYGYAMTADYSQGSQYENVIVMPKDMYFRDGRNAIYTAISRAKKQLWIVI